MAKNSWRAEPYWHWAWPHADEQRPQYAHMAHVLEDNGGPRGTLRAAIYLPQPENASGWELHQVYSDPPPEPPRRKLGL